MELMPDQFWSLTVREFWIKFYAFQRAETRRLWAIGQSALLTTSYKKQYHSPGQLLGYRGPMIRYPTKPWLTRRTESMP